MNPKLARWLSHLVVGFVTAAIAILIHRALDAPLAKRLERLGGD
jgi:hypothetical protein